MFKNKSSLILQLPYEEAEAVHWNNFGEERE